MFLIIVLNMPIERKQKNFSNRKELSLEEDLKKLPTPSRACLRTKYAETP